MTKAWCDWLAPNVKFKTQNTNSCTIKCLCGNFFGGGGGGHLLHAGDFHVKYFIKLPDRNAGPQAKDGCLLCRRLRTSSTEIHKYSSLQRSYRKVPSKRPLRGIHPHPTPVIGPKSCIGLSLYVVNAHPAGALRMTLCKYTC